MALAVPLQAHTHRRIALGTEFSIIIRADSTLGGAGKNSSFQLGLGDTLPRTTFRAISAARWLHVEAGPAYTLAIRSDSTLWGWGSGAGYVFGDGTQNNRSTPTQIGSDRWLTVIAGTGQSNFGIRADSTLWAWGENFYGQLGTGDRETQATPIQIGTAKWLDISTATHTMGIQSDGTLWAWGNGAQGRLGNGGTSGSMVPIRIGSATDWVRVSAGWTMALALRSDGSLWSSGNNSQGATGQGTTDESTLSLTRIGAATWTDMVANDKSSVAIAADKGVYTWGTNAKYQLGIPGGARSSPTSISIAQGRDIGHAAYHGIALDSGGTFWGWGYNSAGELGLGNTSVQTTPVSINPGKTAQEITFPALASKELGSPDFAPGAAASSGLAVSYSSSDTTVATIVSGQIHIVGAGTTQITASQEGNATFDPAPDVVRSLTVSKLGQTIAFAALPRKALGDAPFDLDATASSGLSVAYSSSNPAVAAVSGSTLTLVAAGTAEITASQSGNGMYDAASPVTHTLTVTVPHPLLDNKLSGGEGFLVILHPDSGILTSGYNTTSYQLGLGVAGNRNTFQVASSATDWRHVDAGHSYVLALKNDSTLWGWGSNYGYNLGDGTNTNRTTPSQIGSWRWITVVAGLQIQSSFGIRHDSTLWAWGQNGFGQLGVGNTTARSSPVQIGSSKWLDVSFSTGHTLAIRSDSTLWAWGINTQGRLGNGTTVNSHVPVQIGTAKWRTTAAGGSHSYAIRSDSTLWAWGSNGGGALGLGNSGGEQTSPVQIGADKWLRVYATGLSGVALRADSTLWSWGIANQALGQGHLDDVLVPTQIGDAKWRDFGMAYGDAVAIDTAGNYWSWGRNQYGALGVGTTASRLTPARTLKPNQTLTFPPLAARTPMDADFDPGATASSGLGIAYASSDTTVATLVEGRIHIVGAGTTTITASQAGNDDFNPAASVSQDLTVNRETQTITFDALASKSYGDSAFTLGAIASSGLPVSYSSSDTTVAMVSGSTVTVVGAGSTSITASQAGNAHYEAAPDVQQTLTVGKAPQSITFAALADRSFGDADFAPGATASSGLDITYASSDTLVASIVNGQIHIVGAGTTTITASQAGNVNYEAAPDVQQTLTVGKFAQTITFEPLSARTFGDPGFTLEASASSGLPISYSSSNTAVATVSGSTVTLVGAGTAVLTASQAGNANYEAAPDVQQTLTVGKAPQSITFAALADRSFGDADFAPGATASSGLDITYASSDTTVARIVNGLIHIVGAGTTTLTASQAGNGDYEAAPDVSQGLTVAKFAQTITFEPLSARTFGDPGFTLEAAASSGLPVSYASSDTTVATVSGSTVTVVGAGSATLTASQGGGDDYTAATAVSRILTVNKAAQSIVFPALPDRTFGDADFAPGGVASSGLEISYASSDTTVAHIASGQIHIVGAGSATITASQGGDANHEAAADAGRVLVVAKAPQTVAFGPLTARLFGAAPFSLEAAASSGLPVAYASSNPDVATVSGSTVTVTGPGATVITASQAGNGNYLAAADVAQTLAVGQANQTLAFPALPEKTFGDPDFAPEAASSAGLPVSISSSDTAVARIVDGLIRIVGAGTAAITASQRGTDEFTAAEDVTRTLTVHKAPQILAFAPLPIKTFGEEDFAPGATSSAGLAVAYHSSDTSVALIVDGRIRLKGSGTTVITASQGGSANFLPAADTAQPLTVDRAGHAVTFDLGADTLKIEGDAAFRLAAVSNVGLPVSFASSDTTVARVAGDSVYVGRAGMADLIARQDGDARYAAAPPVTRRFRVLVSVPMPFRAGELFPDSAADLDTNVQLTWPRRAKAEGYRLQMALDTAAAPQFDRTSADTSLALGGLPFGARVFWRAAPFNSTGQAPFSGFARFRVRPEPPRAIDVARIPAMPASGTASTVELAWPPMEGATGYRLQVFLDNAQAPSLDTVLAGPAATLTGLPPGSTQMWRVAPMNGVSQGPFTPWLVFKVREKDESGVSRGVVVDSAMQVKLTDVVAVSPNDGSPAGISVSVTVERRPPASLPPGFQPLTGSISLEATLGDAPLADSQLTLTLTPPDTALDGARVGRADHLVYTVDSATGRLEVIYDLARDSAGNILLPLSKGRSFILAVDTVPPSVKDSTSPASRRAGSAPVIVGNVEDNIRNCRTVLLFRKGGSESFDSVSVTVDASGRFELPLDLRLDSTGFEYHLKATDGRNVKATPRKDVPVEVKAIRAADSLPSMQWRLFALPTLPKEARWMDRVQGLGTYGTDWTLFERAAEGLRELDAAADRAEAGTAYWLKSRRGYLPRVEEGTVAPVSRPFERAVPPRSWIAFGNPFLFPVAWQTVADSTPGASGALVGPYTYRDTAWLAPVQVPVLLPWEGYYAYNASDDTLRLRIPARKAKQAASPLAKTAFHLQWQVRGESGKDAGIFFGGLPEGSSAALAKAAASAGAAAGSGGGAKAPGATVSQWQAPKPENPGAGFRAGFVPKGEAAGLLQTDFREAGPRGGLAWTARLSGLMPGRRYENRFEGFQALPPGMSLALADPATGSFLIWKEGQSYVVEAQAGEQTRELVFYAGSPEFLRSRGAEFAAAHPLALELRHFPNPVRAYAVVRFAVPASAAGKRRVELTVRDMQGRLVKVLAAGSLPTGRHAVRWEARDAQGRPMAAGVYRLLLEVDGKRLHRSLQLLD